MLETNWYVITGAPSSGKTKLIEYLSFLGYHTVPEVARLLIDVEMSKGRKIEEIRGNDYEFQMRILEMKIDVENRTPIDQLTFFDRAIPDSIAYFKISKIDPKRVIDACKKRRYKGVFLLEQLPFDKDYARTEDEKLAKELSDLIEDSYISVGYKVVHVPVKPITERAKFILDRIEK
jgi:predicted ATPase